MKYFRRVLIGLAVLAPVIYVCHRYRFYIIYASYSLLPFLDPFSDPALRTSDVIWSFDNKWAAVSMDTGSLKERTKNFSCQVWLTDAQLKPVKRLLVSQPGFAHMVYTCFSRDSSRLFFRNDRSARIQTVNLDALDDPPATALSYGRNWPYHIVPAKGDGVYIRDGGIRGNLLYWHDGTIDYVLKKPLSEGIFPFMADAAHRDSVREGKAQFLTYTKAHPSTASAVSKTIPDNTIDTLWAFPLGQTGISSASIETEQNPPDLIWRSPDADIRIFSIKDEKSLRYILYGDGRRIDIEAGKYATGRKKIAVIEDESLVLLNEYAEKKTVLKKMPEKDLVLLQYNEDINLVCLESAEAFYLVECGSGKVTKISKAIYAPKNE